MSAGLGAVVVTGAGGGIGRAIALALGSDARPVVCLDVDDEAARATAAAVRAAGGDAHAVGCDVTDPTAVERGFAEAADRYGPLDGLVANAGGARGRTVALLDVDDDEWSSMIALNLSGAFYCLRAAARRMAPRGRGAVVMVTSLAAHAAVPGLAHYAAAKAGVRALVATAAAELAPHGVRVNAVAPGTVVTEGNAGRLSDPAQRDRLTALIPLRRFGEASEVVGAVRYLLSDASSFTTGTTIRVDGGQTC